VTVRHWCCCQDDGQVALCGTDLSEVPWVVANEDVVVTAQVTSCVVCLEMQAEAPVNQCPRYGRRCEG
jgi:hypothetical protein